ncbi:hypothetical protein Scep_009338 [Stephania cephalantha]|uniref:Peptidase A1 domain-containing protein n=1 Tax=Stephania cephalantha TaxID=152367 RepID=A0AAP0PD22_9MAGN
MSTDHSCPILSTCTTAPTNTISGVSTKGELVHQSILAKCVLGLLVSRAPASLLRGLARGAGGMAGLGRGRIGLPAQVLLGDRKFFVCVPKTSGGFVYFGDELLLDYRVAKYMLYTPLVASPSEPDEYFIGVKSIKINGRAIDFDGSLLSFDENGYGGTKLSTVVAYTTLETSIYKAFTKAFVGEATTGFGFNMSRVASVAPFEYCFLNSKSVPVIDLVLQSEMVKWRIHGWNSMVNVSDDVMCLGFLDGGVMNQTTSAVIVIGGNQLENNLVEFDLEGSRLGFSSLLDKQSRCSDFSSLGGESRSW